MKRAPLRLWLVLALFCCAGILKATLPPITIGNWTATTSLSQARANGAAVLLNDGRILFTGGDSGGAVQGAELFNADGTVSSASAMNVARSQHFAVVMSDGRVLVGGGNTAGGGTTNSAEIYDPSSGNWTSTGPMNSARANATAALLQDGRVVIAGGDNAGAANNTIEMYDPTSGNFSVASGTLSSPRTKHAMALLQSGQVLMIGGFDGTNPLASTDVFDPSADTIAAGPALATARYSATATTLLNGQVAVIGGAGSGGGTTDLSSIEIFDPTTGVFSTVSAKLATAREGHQAYLLPNNNSVLVTGGTSGGTALASSELFMAQASSLDGSWGYSVSSTGAMTAARTAASGAANQTNVPYSVVRPMPGLVIVGGGTDPSGATLASTEAYGYPIVQTDQSDYPPGTTVYIKGSGFQPNENVTITLVESPLFDTHGPYTVQADASGNFTDASFTTDVHDQNIRFFMSAVGQQSKLVAQNTFTDANNDPNTLTISCVSTTITIGTSTACTATETDTQTTGPNGPPQGNVGFAISPADGSFSPASCTLGNPSGETSTCQTTFTATAAGSATITGTYTRANNNWANNTKGTLNITVNKRTTGTSILLTPASLFVGQPSSVSITVTDTDAGAVSNPTGTLTLTSTDTGDVFTACNLTASGVNQAKCTASVTPANVGASPHTITATYGGDAAHLTSSQAAALTVNQATTTTTLVSSANPSNFGQSVTFTATVAAVSPGAGSPTGTITFKDGATTLGTGTLSTTGGVTTATFSTPTLAIGGHSITATYPGDGNFTTSTSSTLNQTVNTASTTTTIASSANPSVFGQSVTFTATVSASGSSAPTGSVTFKDGTTSIGTGTLSTSGGFTTASFTTNSLTIGPHSITATYGGDSNFSGSTASALAETVAQASTTTSLASSPNPSVLGQAVLFTVTVAPVAPGAGTPTGTVTLTMGNTTEGTGALSAGQATISVSGLPVGSNGIKASYAGDANFSASATQNALSQTVNKASTTTALTTSLSPSVFGQSVTFTATVTVDAPGVGTIPAGETVTFKDGATTLGTGTTNASGAASLATTTLSVATHSITAVYAGDTNFATSTSSALSQVVDQASTTTTVVSSANPSSNGQSVTFTATVVAVAPGSGNPTGTVTFKDGANTVGTGTLSTTAGVTSATFSTSSLASGSHSITAVYGGDTNFSGSTSAPLTQTVLSPPSIAKAFGAATIPLNGTTSLTFTITNPASNPLALSGVAFTDSLPAGLVVATPSGAVDNCGGTVTAAAGSGSISLAGGPVAANQSCTVSVNVTGMTAGLKSNTTGHVTSTNGGTGNTASANITVVAPPTISKAFGAPQINLNTSTSLTITINNPNGNTLSGLSFTDTLPAGLIVATPNPFLGNTCGGTATAVAGSGSVTLSGGTVAANNSCSVSVNVTATSTGLKSNTITSVSSNEGGNGGSTSAILNVVGVPPTITSGNSATFIAGIANAFLITTNGTPAPSLSFTGTLPSGISFSDNGNGSASIAYNGTSVTAGNYPIVIKATNGVPPDASQNFTVNVVAGAPASVSVFSASGQSTTVTMAFANPLVALVEDASHNTVSGATVLFAAPASGPSGSFVGSATATTDANGLASASFAANTAAGSYLVTASVSGVATPASFMLTNLAGPTTTLAITPATATITAGQSEKYTAEGTDQYNNPTGDLTASTTFTISPDGSCSTVGSDPATCTTNVADLNGSSHTVTGTYTNNAKGVASLTVTAGAFIQLQLLVPGETAAPGTGSGKSGSPITEYVNGKFKVTVNAADQFFNVVSSVTDTAHFVSNDTDPNTKLPADAALVNGTGTFSVTLQTVSFNPNKTTITVSDVSDSSISSDTSPALEVIIAATANINPTMVGTGDPQKYTMVVNDAPAPNTNHLGSIEVAVPGADQGSITGVSVAAANQGGPVNWSYDLSKLPGTLRFLANTGNDAVTPGGTITITFTATSNATVTTGGSPISEAWTTHPFADAASSNGLPLAGPEPTVEVGAAPKIVSDKIATFTFGAPGPSFIVMATGVPTPILSESGTLAPGLTFTANGDGTATISGTPTIAGNYPITITAHSGFGPDATQAFTIVVNKADSVSTIVSDANPSVFGQSVTFTATVTAGAPATGTPTGSVQFMDGTTLVGSPQAMNSSGKASVSTSTLNVASHSITAVYSGDANFNQTGFDAASQAIAFPQEVDKANTTSTVVSSVNPSVFGQPATFTVTVSAVAPGSGTPAGNVTFLDGTTSLGSGTLSGGVATLTTSALSVGPHTITAVYNGDANFNGGTSNQLYQTVNKADTTTTITGFGPEPSIVGETVTVSFTVVAKAPGTGTPTANVTVTDGTVSCTASVATGNCALPFTTAGNKSVTASYAGDTNFNSSVSAAASHTVNPADTKTYVASSLNPSTFGQSVTFTANVNVVAPGSGTPSGTVQFADNGSPLGGPVTLTGTQATFTSYSLSAGPHSITANYSGDGNFNATGVGASTAVPFSQTVNKANATINVVAYTDVTFDGNPHMATGSATGVKGEALAGLDLSGTTHTDAGTYTDTWKFTDVTGNYNNASGTVADTILQAPSFTAVTCPPNVTYNGQAQTPCSALVTGAVLNLQFTPTYINNLNAGTATASFTYTGDPNHTGSAGSANFTINPASTGTTVTSSPNPSNWMQVVTITANVVNSSATNVQPVGSVNFYNAPGGATCSTLQGNTTALIGTGALSAGVDPNTSTATVATQPPVGTDTILACYNNFNPSDPNYNGNFGVSSGSISQTVIPAPIVTLVPTSLSFGTQAAGTKSGAQSVTICNGPSGVLGAPCYGVPVATAALNISSIALGGNNPGDFIFATSPANNCGGSIAMGSSCTVNIQFAPQGGSSGVESAFLNVTDNNGNVAGSVEAASVSGAGLSTIGPVAGSLSSYAVYAMNNGCSAVTISGNGTVDNGNVGANGNVSLSGNPLINGAVYSPFGTTGSCSGKSVTGLSTSGKAQATGGVNTLSGPQVYPLPPVPNPAPPTTNWNITSCPSGMTGCTNNGSKNVTLAPGQYGNLTVSGGTTAHVARGTYNLNGLTLSGNSVLYVDSGPVVMNLAGALLSSNGAAIDSSGGSIVNPSGVTSNLQIYFAGSNPMKLSGGSGSYALVYAPNSAVSLTGGSHFYGSIVANTVNSTGNTAIHGDVSLAAIASGDTLWFSSAGLKVQGLPASGTVKLYATNATISFTAGGNAYTVPVPNAVITFSSTATTASTTWDSANNRWSTLVPISSVNNNGTMHTFFDGVAFPVPANFPNGIQNVTFQAAYSTTSTGISFNWQWGAALYSSLGSNSALGINPLDGADPAGTPENYRSYLLFGDLGPGFVGMYQGTTSVVPTIAPASIAPSSFNFGAVTKTQPSLPMTLTLTNNQSGTLTMGAGTPPAPPVIAITGANAADFLFTNNCPAAGLTLNGGGGSCTVTVTFTPSTTGVEKAKLSVYDSAPNSPQTVFLTGTGQ